ncbi:MAG: hypothetical protein HYX27_27505 [Acidobacteria bacterium]|nr:hypothetical protein [Acidobacteriota bacterium]
MKVILLAVAMIPVAAGAELDTRILRLITADTQMVAGAELRRLEGTRLAKHTETLDDSRADAAVNRIDRVVIIKDRSHQKLAVTFGEFHEPALMGDENWTSISVEPGIRFEGKPEVVRVALAAWKDAGQKPSPLAEKVQQLAASYDAWAVVLDPLPERGGKGIAPPPLTQWDLLRASVREVSGGVRLGGIHQFYASATLATSEDADTAAALVRWLPAFAQQSAPQEIRQFIEVMSAIQTHRSGTSVEMTFTIEDQKIEIPPAPAKDEAGQRPAVSID